MAHKGVDGLWVNREKGILLQLEGGEHSSWINNPFTGAWTSYKGVKARIVEGEGGEEDLYEGKYTALMPSRNYTFIVTWCMGLCGEGSMFLRGVLTVPVEPVVHVIRDGVPADSAGVRTDGVVIPENTLLSY